MRIKQVLYYQQGGKCFYCGKRLNLADATIDHVIPQSMGGSSNEDNLVVCCQAINQLFANAAPKYKLSTLMAWQNQLVCPASLIQAATTTIQPNNNKPAPAPKKPNPPAVKTLTADHKSKLATLKSTEERIAEVKQLIKTGFLLPDANAIKKLKFFAGQPMSNKNINSLLQQLKALQH